MKQESNNLYDHMTSDDELLQSGDFKEMNKSYDSNRRKRVTYKCKECKRQCKTEVLYSIAPKLCQYGVAKPKYIKVEVQDEE